MRSQEVWMIKEENHNQMTHKLNSPSSIEVFLNENILSINSFKSENYKKTEAWIRINLKILPVNCVLLALRWHFGPLHEGLQVRIILLIIQWNSVKNHLGKPLLYKQ